MGVTNYLLSGMILQVRDTPYNPPGSCWSPTYKLTEMVIYTAQAKKMWGTVGFKPPITMMTKHHPRFCRKSGVLDIVQARILQLILTRVRMKGLKLFPDPQKKILHPQSLTARP